MITRLFKNYTSLFCIYHTVYDPYNHQDNRKFGSKDMCQLQDGKLMYEASVCNSGTETYLLKAL